MGQTLTHKSTILIEALIGLKGQVEKYIVIDTRLLTWATSSRWRESKGKGGRKEKRKTNVLPKLLHIRYRLYILKLFNCVYILILK